MLKEQVREYMKDNLGIDDEETFSALYDNYKETVVENMEKIEKFLAEGNFPELRAAAHALKGCSANIGAENMRSTSFEIETAAKNSDIPTARAAFERLRNHSRDV